MSFFVEALGRNGLIFLIGTMIFVLSYKYSINIFDWVEHQTYGTRSYITEKLEFLFIEIPQDRLTYMLLGLSVGLGFFTFILVGFIGSWIVGAILGSILAFVGFKAPRVLVDFLVERRIKAYSLQMVDALQLLSNGIRAGLSVPQAIGMIVEEMPAPFSPRKLDLFILRNHFTDSLIKIQRLHFE